MHHGPLLLAERADAVFGDHAAGIAVIGAEAEQPLIAHVGQVGIGAADHHRLAELDHIGRHRMDLGRADRAEKGDDVGLRGELGERQHDAGIGGLIVLDDQFGLLAEHAAGLVDGVERKLGALDRVSPGFGGRSGHRRAHADLDRGALRPGATDDMGCGNTGSDANREIASRKFHPFLPEAGLLCRPFLVLASAREANPCSYLRTLSFGVN